MIPFNKPYLTGSETKYIEKAVSTGKISGNGLYTKKCQRFFEDKFKIKKCLLTTSCTDALEMAAILINIKPGDEVIMPSYTFVSTANAFVLRGAKIIFADSESSNPNIDVTKIEGLVSKRTKAIVVVHYAGVACDMDHVMSIAERHNLFVVEDAAQAIDSYYKGRALGSIGHLATFSFHETKNIISGEGGLLAINDERFLERAEIIWEKGTNRSAFFRGEVDKYGWVDVGSSFLPSEVIAAFLWAQLENLDEIQNKRKQIWEGYNRAYSPLHEQGLVRTPIIPDYATNNAHMYYLLVDDVLQRSKLINHLKSKGVHAVFHYLPLHESPYFENQHDGRSLHNVNRFADCLLRLPMFYELNNQEESLIWDSVVQFFLE